MHRSIGKELSTIDTLKKVGKKLFDLYFVIGVVAMALLAALVIFAVIARYFFALSWKELSEFNTTLFAFTTFWGMGINVIKDEHVMIDIFYDRVKPARKRWLAIGNYLIVLVAHPDFPRLMADLEIYVNGTALKQAQGANAIVDTMSATVIKKHNPGMSDTQLRQLITAHIDEDEFCRYVIQRDINGIALALRETHKDDFFSVPEDNPLKEMLETAGEIVSQDSDTEQAYLAFICKRLKLNFRKLSVEERKWLKKIAEKSDLLKNPKPQRGRR